MTVAIKARAKKDILMFNSSSLGWETFTTFDDGELSVKTIYEFCFIHRTLVTVRVNQETIIPKGAKPIELTQLSLGSNLFKRPLDAVHEIQ